MRVLGKAELGSEVREAAGRVGLADHRAGDHRPRRPVRVLMRVAHDGERNAQARPADDGTPGDARVGAATLHLAPASGERIGSDDGRGDGFGARAGRDAEGLERGEERGAGERRPLGRDSGRRGEQADGDDLGQARHAPALLLWPDGAIAPEAASRPSQQLDRLGT